MGHVGGGGGWGVGFATAQESFYAWVDIQEFREIPTADYRRGKSMHIYQKYIREGAVLQVCWTSVSEAMVKLGFSVCSLKTTYNRLIDDTPFPKLRLLRCITKFSGCQRCRKRYNGDTTGSTLPG